MVGVVPPIQERVWFVVEPAFSACCCSLARHGSSVWSAFVSISISLSLSLSLSLFLLSLSSLSSLLSPLSSLLSPLSSLLSPLSSLLSPLSSLLSPLSLSLSLSLSPLSLSLPLYWLSSSTDHICVLRFHLILIVCFTSVFHAATFYWNLC